MWDRVIQNSISFWQTEKHCAILLSVIEDKFFMDVMFYEPSRIAINMSNYFRGV